MTEIAFLPVSFVFLWEKHSILIKDTVLELKYESRIILLESWSNTTFVAA